jgi:ABC-type polysaccharide/polyol phosphate export permease
MAMAFLPAGLVVLASAPQISLVISKVPTPVIILVGFTAFVAAYALFLRATPSMPYVEFLLPTMILIGIGFALCFAALNVQATSGVADHEQGLASGLLNTSLQVGGAVVLAVVTAILGNTTSVHHDQLLPHAHTAVAVVMGVSIGAVLMTVVHLYRERQLVFATAATETA